MVPREPLGPFCQSCSLPLTQPEDFGTATSGYRVNDYCRHCYQVGAFTDPGITMGEMIDQGAGMMARQGIMSLANARLILTEVMSGLKRWQRLSPQGAVEGATCSVGPADEQC